MRAMNFFSPDSFLSLSLDLLSRSYPFIAWDLPFTAGCCRLNCPNTSSAICNVYVNVRHLDVRARRNFPQVLEPSHSKRLCPCTAVIYSHNTRLLHGSITGPLITTLALHPPLPPFSKSLFNTVSSRSTALPMKAQSIAIDLPAITLLDQNAQ